MTLDELVNFLGAHPLPVAGLLVLPPLFCALLGWLHGKGGGGGFPWKYVYTVLLYLVCVPGAFAAVLTAYLLFFRNADLMRVNVLVFFLPLGSMAVTLVLVKRNVGAFDRVPGFGRLTGLLALLGVSFALAFVLHRMHFGIVFLGPLGSLITVALLAFALLKWGANKLTGNKEDRTLAEAAEPKK